LGNTVKAVLVQPTHIPTFSALVNNRVYKITCFQLQVGLVNEYKGFILVQAHCDEVIALCPVVFIDALGVTKREELSAQIVHV
jgi:hypothetical protein